MLAAATLAVVTVGAAYTFGPSAEPVGAAAATAAAAPTVGAAGEVSATAACPVDARYPKRQMRGIWIATTKNIDWPSRTGLPVARQQAEYVRILDSAVKRRFNAVFVQVRPASDALYASTVEPWSEYLTGKAGKHPGWDPLPFLVAEAHKRGLEFHAWFNPYRASYGTDLGRLPVNHPARIHPDWIVKYGGQSYYNPGLPQVRDHVTSVVKDVVSRYDVDGVHFDDYFYPYPVGGATFADGAAFKKYGKGTKLAAWRRSNVDKLVAQVDKTVHETKKYVKFGISPFGIWRNKSDDPTGSATAGMSAYDSIYADSRHWIRQGTVDYVIPQLYWPRGFKVADYNTLMPWWAKEVRGTGVDLYIGQALYQVGTGGAWTNPGELASHLTANRKYGEVKGDVYFSAKQLLTNPLGALDRIAKSTYPRPALLPLIKGLGGQAPATPAEVRLQGKALTWKTSANARSYAVYRVPSGKPGKCATADARNLVAVVPAVGGARQTFAAAAGGAYLVTALDRLGNESAPTNPALA
ncbi:glycoside hydrolase family 10 protein [Streptosporangium subroseum]|uniref:glycoside hydrolase family 10 protein n=1 Tax=Streptosporangium subroseum TaxID=106412 RepID=UPI003085DB40|nr:family 10 glycosylhydrolase [Streptosporangium subroseum]